MAYLTNRAVNLLNIHFALHALVMNGAGVFWAVYLLKAGVPTPAVFGSLALLLAARFVFRPTILLLAPRFGLRALVAFGTVFSALQYLVLAEVRGVDLMLLLLCIVGAIGDTFYWTCYHAYFATLGDIEHRAKQISAREASSALSAIVGPLVGGWALMTLGPRAAFGAAAAVQVLCALSFLGTPDVKVERQVQGGFTSAIPGVLLFAADGWIVAGYLFAWQIALFLALGENFSAFGGVLALAALVGAIAGLLLGKHIDAGRGLRAVWLTFGSLAAVTVLRAVSTQDVAMAVIANALGALAVCLYMPTVMTSVYNLAKRSPCPLRFHVATEGGWDIGGAAGCLAAAILSALGVPLSFTILLSLAGAGLSIYVLRHYYSGLGAVADAAIAEPASPDLLQA